MSADANSAPDDGQVHQGANINTQPGGVPDQAHPPSDAPPVSRASDNEANPTPPPRNGHGPAAGPSMPPNAPPVQDTSLNTAERARLVLESLDHDPPVWRGLQAHSAQASVEQIDESEFELSVSDTQTGQNEQKESHNSLAVEPGASPRSEPTAPSSPAQPAQSQVDDISASEFEVDSEPSAQTPAQPASQSPQPGLEQIKDEEFETSEAIDSAPQQVSEPGMRSLRKPEIITQPPSQPPAQTPASPLEAIGAEEFELSTAVAQAGSLESIGAEEFEVSDRPTAGAAPEHGLSGSRESHMVEAEYRFSDPKMQKFVEASNSGMEPAPPRIRIVQSQKAPTSPQETAQDPSGQTQNGAQGWPPAQDAGRSAAQQQQQPAPPSLQQSSHSMTAGAPPANNQPQQNGNAQSNSPVAPSQSAASQRRSSSNWKLPTYGGQSGEAGSSDWDEPMNPELSLRDWEIPMPTDELKPKAQSNQTPAKDWGPMPAELAELAGPEMPPPPPPPPQVKTPTKPTIPSPIDFGKGAGGRDQRSSSQNWPSHTPQNPNNRLTQPNDQDQIATLQNVPTLDLGAGGGRLTEPAPPPPPREIAEPAVQPPRTLAQALDSITKPPANAAQRAAQELPPGQPETPQSSAWTAPSQAPGAASQPPGLVNAQGWPQMTEPAEPPVDRPAAESVRASWGAPPGAAQSPPSSTWGPAADLGRSPAAPPAVSSHWGPPPSTVAATGGSAAEPASSPPIPSPLQAPTSSSPEPRFRPQTADRAAQGAPAAAEPLPQEAGSSPHGSSPQPASQQQGGPAAAHPTSAPQWGPQPASVTPGQWGKLADAHTDAGTGEQEPAQSTSQPPPQAQEPSTTPPAPQKPGAAKTTEPTWGPEPASAPFGTWGQLPSETGASKSAPPSGKAGYGPGTSTQESPKYGGQAETGMVKIFEVPGPKPNQKLPSSSTSELPGLSGAQAGGAIRVPPTAERMKAGDKQLPVKRQEEKDETNAEAILTEKTERQKQPQPEQSKAATPRPAQPPETETLPDKGLDKGSAKGAAARATSPHSGAHSAYSRRGLEDRFFLRLLTTKWKMLVLMGVFTILIISSVGVMLTQMKSGKGVNLFASQVQKSMSPAQREGEDCLKDGLYTQAINYFDEAIKAHPDRADAYHDRGQAYLKLQNYQQAIQDQTKALSLTPDYDDALLDRAAAYFYINENQKAINDYTNILKREPKNTDALFGRGLNYSALNEHTKALYDLDRVTNDAPENIQAWEQKGAVYFQMKLYDKAVDAFDEAIKRNPKSAAAHYQRANAYRHLNKKDEAVEDFSQALAISPGRSDYYNDRGYTLLELHYVRDAMADFASALLIDPTDKLAKTNLDNTFNDYMKDCQLHLSVNASNPKTLADIAYAYMCKSDPQKALENANKALALQSDNIEALKIRAEAELELNQVSDAIKDATVAMSTDQKAMPAHLCRARAYLRTKKYQEALEDYNTCVNAPPFRNQMFAVRERVLLNVILDQPSQAIQDAKRFLSLSGWNNRFTGPTVLLEWLAYHQLQNNDGARAVIDEAKQKISESTWPYPILKYLSREMPAKDLPAKANSTEELADVRTWRGFERRLEGLQSAAGEDFAWVREKALPGTDDRILADSQPR